MEVSDEHNLFDADANYTHSIIDQLFAHILFALDYEVHYASCMGSNASSALHNATAEMTVHGCERDNFLLFLLLMIGTVWLAVKIYNFKDT